MSPSQKLFSLLLLLPLGSFTTFPEELPGLAKPVIPNLHPLLHNAGYIFSGKAKAVERISPSGAGAVPVMRITFQVEKGFRGVRSGQDLVIREWASLWRAGERYRPGERVMLFLYPPSKLGLTSPVGGQAGRFDIDPGGRIITHPGPIGIGPPRPLPGDPGREKTRMSPEEFVRVLRNGREE